METLEQVLPIVWFGILALFLSIYLITDGFDLGVGILSLKRRNEEERGVLISSLSSVWDANETWLVCTGGILFGAFPLAYGTIVNALYIPITLMVIGFILRAVSFEFREYSHNKTFWSLAFGGGSLLTTLSQGLILGGVLAGIKVDETGAFIGGIWDWLNFPSILVAITVVQGYGMVGSTYLILKTTGELQKTYYRTALSSTLGALIGAIVITAAVPVVYEHTRDRLFHQPGIFIFALIPLLAIFAVSRLIHSLNEGQETTPFIWSVVIFIITILGLAFVIFPYIIPMKVTIFEASSSLSSQVFMIMFIGFFIPIMLFYNAYLYRVFRGKAISSHYGE